MSQFLATKADAMTISRLADKLCELSECIRV